VDVVSLSIELLVLGYQIHRGSNSIPYSPVVNQIKVEPLSSPHWYDKDIVISDIFHRKEYIAI
jgi:hypothetical protein